MFIFFSIDSSCIWMHNPPKVMKKYDIYNLNNGLMFTVLKLVTPLVISRTPPMIKLMNGFKSKICTIRVHSVPKVITVPKIIKRDSMELLIDGVIVLINEIYS